jgi:hypothetical protein
VLSCPPLRLLKGTPRRHSPDEARRWAQTYSQAAMNYAPSTEPSLVPCRCDQKPMGSCCGHRERKRLHFRRRASRSPLLAGEVPFLLPITLLHGTLQYFSPLALGWKTCIMGASMTNCCSPRCSKGTIPMSEPTQDLIVSELRRRMSVSIADLTHVLGLQFASVLPQEIQRMKASGLVVYDEPLGPSSVVSLPR